MNSIMEESMKKKKMSAQKIFDNKINLEKEIARAENDLKTNLEGEDPILDEDTIQDVIHVIGGAEVNS